MNARLYYLISLATVLSYINGDEYWRDSWVNQFIRKSVQNDNHFIRNDSNHTLQCERVYEDNHGRIFNKYKDGLKVVSGRCRIPKYISSASRKKDDYDQLIPKRIWQTWQTNIVGIV